MPHALYEETHRKGGEGADRYTALDEAACAAAARSLAGKYPTYYEMVHEVDGDARVPHARFPCTRVDGARGLVEVPVPYRLSVVLAVTARPSASEDPARTGARGCGPVAISAAAVSRVVERVVLPRLRKMLKMSADESIPPFGESLHVCEGMRLSSRWTPADARTTVARIFVYNCAVRDRAARLLGYAAASLNTTHAYMGRWETVCDPRAKSETYAKAFKATVAKALANRRRRHGCAVRRGDGDDGDGGGRDDEGCDPCSRGAREDATDKLGRGALGKEETNEFQISCQLGTSYLDKDRDPDADYGAWGGFSFRLPSGTGTPSPRIAYLGDFHISVPSGLGALTVIDNIPAPSKQLSFDGEMASVHHDPRKRGGFPRATEHPCTCVAVVCTTTVGAAITDRAVHMFTIQPCGTPADLMSSSPIAQLHSQTPQDRWIRSGNATVHVFDSAQRALPEDAGDEARHTAVMRDSAALAVAVFGFMRDERPHVIVSHNGHGFDFPYLWRLVQFYGDVPLAQTMFMTPWLGRPVEFRYDGFGRWMDAVDTLQNRRQGDHGGFPFRVRAGIGCVNLDTCVSARAFLPKQTSYKLDALATSIVGVGKIGVGGAEVTTAWLAGDVLGVCAYCVVDTVITADLAYAMDVLNRSEGLSGVCGSLDAQICSEATTAQRKIVAANAYLNLKNEMVCGSSEHPWGDLNGYQYEGGVVGQPRVGLPRKGLYTLIDFNSLYPHVQMSYNLGLSTITSLGEITDAGLDVGDFDRHTVEIRVPADHDTYMRAKRARKTNPKHNTMHTVAVDVYVRRRDRGPPPNMNAIFNRVMIENRSKARKELKAAKKRLASLPEGHPDTTRLLSIIPVLQGTQLGYKVLGNSGYGFLAAEGSPMQCTVLAALVTMLGRKATLMTATIVCNPDVFGGLARVGPMILRDGATVGHMVADAAPPLRDLHHALLIHEALRRGLCAELSLDGRIVGCDSHEEDLLSPEEAGVVMGAVRESMGVSDATSDTAVLISIMEVVVESEGARTREPDACPKDEYMDTDSLFMRIPDPLIPLCIRHVTRLRMAWGILVAWAMVWRQVHHPYFAGTTLLMDPELIMRFFLTQPGVAKRYYCVGAEPANYRSWYGKGRYDKTMGMATIRGDCTPLLRELLEELKLDSTFLAGDGCEENVKRILVNVYAQLLHAATLPPAAHTCDMLSSTECGCGAAADPKYRSLDHFVKMQTLRDGGAQNQVITSMHRAASLDEIANGRAVTYMCENDAGVVTPVTVKGPTPVTRSLSRLYAVTNEPPMRGSTSRFVQVTQMHGATAKRAFHQQYPDPHMKSARSGGKTSYSIKLPGGISSGVYAWETTLVEQCMAASSADECPRINYAAYVIQMLNAVVSTSAHLIDPVVTVRLTAHVADLLRHAQTQHWHHAPLERVRASLFEFLDGVRVDRPTPPITEFLKRGTHGAGGAANVQRRKRKTSTVKPPPSKRTTQTSLTDFF